MESAVDEIPGFWLDDRAELAQRMSTDVPLAGLPASSDTVYHHDTLVAREHRGPTCWR
ncbi:MAG: hypothetical protein ACRCYR_20415 [Phycicoccus sp.]